MNITVSFVQVRHTNEVYMNIFVVNKAKIDVVCFTEKSKVTDNNPW